MIIGFISKLVRTITLSKVVIWSLTALLCITLYTMYENRGRFMSLFQPPEITTLAGVTFTVGNETRAKISDIVKNDDAILGISIMSADLRINEARTMFFTGDDAALNEMNSVAVRSDSNRLPLFTSVDENNAEVIRLINGQFSCIDFKQTLRSKLYPELGVTVLTVCHASIPSYYGYFSGFLEVYLGVVPNSERQLQLKLIIEKLSNDVYFKDVLGSQQTEPTTQRVGNGP